MTIRTSRSRSRSRSRSTSRSPHWARLGEKTFVTGIWLLWGIHRLFGRRLFRCCVAPVVLWYWAVSPLARDASLQYLRRVQQQFGSIGHTPGWRDTLRHFNAFAESMLNKLLGMSGRYNFGAMRLEGHEALQAVLASGRGAMLVTAHVGCLELCRTLADRYHGLTLTVLVHTAHAEQFNRILKQLDPHSCVRLLPVTEITPATAVDLNACIERGELVAITGDRIPVQTSKTITLPFLGADAPFPVGAYVLAALMHCPLFFMACVRSDDDYVVVFEPLAEHVVLPRGQRDAVLLTLAQRYVASLEAIVRRAPFEWFNFYPYWNQKEQHERS